MGEQLVRQRFALSTELCNGAAEVDGVPEDDGHDREVEAGGTVALIFEGAVPTRALLRATRSMLQLQIFAPTDTPENCAMYRRK